MELQVPCVHLADTACALMYITPTTREPLRVCDGVCVCVRVCLYGCVCVCVVVEDDIEPGFVPPFASLPPHLAWPDTHPRNSKLDKVCEYV